MGKNEEGEKMTRKLPVIIYKGKKYYVDFRLEELRRVADAKPIKFTELKEGPKSALKKKLRGIRFKTSVYDYIRGLDD